MIYNITNAIEKEWNGKPFKEAELTDNNGEVFKVSAWGGEFDNKTEWEGELVKNDKGYWKLVTKKAVAGNNFKSAQIEKVMEKKEQSISNFQSNKEEGIKTASTIRMAVDIATSMPVEQWQGTTMQEEIRFWREWLAKEWDLPAF